MEIARQYYFEIIVGELFVFVKVVWFILGKFYYVFFFLTYAALWQIDFTLKACLCEENDILQVCWAIPDYSLFWTILEFHIKNHFKMFPRSTSKKISYDWQLPNFHILDDSRIFIFLTIHIFSLLTIPEFTDTLEIWEISKICLRHVPDLSRTCPRLLQEIPPDMSQN